MHAFIACLPNLHTSTSDSAGIAGLSQTLDSHLTNTSLPVEVKAAVRMMAQVGVWFGSIACCVLSVCSIVLACIVLYVVLLLYCIVC